MSALNPGSTGEIGGLCTA